MSCATTDTSNERPCQTRMALKKAQEALNGRTAVLESLRVHLFMIVNKQKIGDTVLSPQAVEVIRDLLEKHPINDG